MTTKVTVIIPARNRAGTLGACLESVLGQTVPPAEVIVVDDGSTDGTSDVAARYAPRVRCQRWKVSRGGQAARNEGIRHSTHDWIAFQDSDDVWLPSKLETQLAALNSVGTGLQYVVHCNAYMRDMTSGFVREFPIETFAGNCYRELLLRPGPMFQGLLVHKSKLREIDLLDEACPSYQEWDTAIRLAKISRFIHVPERLFEWRWHAAGAISKDSKRDFGGFKYVTEKHRAAIFQHHGPQGWARMRSMTAMKGLQLGCFDEVRAMVASEPLRLENLLIRGFSELRYCPPGVARILRLASRLHL